MKNILENFALFLVILLGLIIGYLIYQYNSIEDDYSEDISSMIHSKKISAKTKSNNYLNSLEGYGDDTDVKVDATQEDSANKVIVKSESSEHRLSDVVDDKTKNTYMQNLENYAQKAKEEKLDTLKPVKDNLDDPEKLAQDEIIDDIGMAIDAALDGI
jgi:lipopolysaccharide export LptBFGC system permease protein LptF